MGRFSVGYSGVIRFGKVAQAPGKRPAKARPTTGKSLEPLDLL